MNTCFGPAFLFKHQYNPKKEPAQFRIRLIHDNNFGDYFLVIKHEKPKYAVKRSDHSVWNPDLLTHSSYRSEDERKRVMSIIASLESHVKARK